MTFNDPTSPDARRYTGPDARPLAHAQPPAPYGAQQQPWPSYSPQPPSPPSQTYRTGPAQQPQQPQQAAQPSRRPRAEVQRIINRLKSWALAGSVLGFGALTISIASHVASTSATTATNSTAPTPDTSNQTQSPSDQGNYFYQPSGRQHFGGGDNDNGSGSGSSSNDSPPITGSGAS